jgi:hypothetical protein
MGPPTTGIRRKLNKSIEDDVQNNQPKKKRRMSTAMTGAQPIITQPIEYTTALAATNALEDALREDPDTTENVNFAQVRLYGPKIQIMHTTDTYQQEILSSVNDQQSQKRQETLPRMQSVPKETRPMTPISPVVTSHPPDRDSPASHTPGRAVPVPTFASSSKDPAASPALGTMNASPGPHAAGHQAPSRQRLVLVLEKADGSYNDDDPLPHTHLRESNVNEFFSLFAETSNKSLDSLECLTFTFMFAPAAANKRVVHKGDEVEWDKLKKKVVFFFNLLKTDLDMEEFQVVVQIGDRKNRVTVMDAMWGV